LCPIKDKKNKYKIKLLTIKRVELWAKALVFWRHHNPGINAGDSEKPDMKGL